MWTPAFLQLRYGLQIGRFYQSTLSTEMCSHFERAEMSKLKDLRALLNSLPSGPIENYDVESLIASCWYEFDGADDGGMEDAKLCGRMESIEWDPPWVSFKIERHGGMAFGSSRAEMQLWSLNVETLHSEFEECGYRQINPRDRPLTKKKLKELVDRLVDKVLKGEQDPWLRWKNEDEFLVLIGQIIPDSCPRETRVSRRKRVREAFSARMQEYSWNRVSLNHYRKAENAAVAS